jgi:hypothetical protein
VTAREARAAAFAVLALLAAGGAFLWVRARAGSPGGPEPGPADVRIAKTTDERGLAAPDLADPSSTPPSNGALPLPDDSPAAPSRVGFRLRGRVRDPNGTVPKGTTVVVTGRVKREERTLARATPDATGAFALEAKAPDGDGPWRVDVDAWAPGRMRVAVDVSVAPGADAEVDLRFPEGGGIHGRVVDPDGKPVPDLRLALVNGGSANMFANVAPPDPFGGEVRGPWDTSLVATAITAADGSFGVVGVPLGGHAPLSLDDAWWLTVDGAESGILEAGPDAVRLLAREAFRLEATVVPADPEDDPDEWPAVATVVKVPDGNTWSLTGPAGTPRLVRGQVPTSRRAGFVATVTADTNLHRPTTLEVPFAPGAWRRSEKIALVRLPASALGTLVLESALEDAAGTPLPLALLVRRTHAPRQTTGEWIRLESKGGGRFSGAARAGRGTFEVHAQGPVRGLFLWKGEIDVAAGEETPFRVPWPPHARVRFRLPPSDAKGRGTLRVAVTADGEARSAVWKGEPKDGEIVLPAVPAGDVEATWQSAAGIRKARFVVPAGGEVSADLVP